MKFRLFIYLSILFSVTPLLAKLETKLEDNGGHHFRFEGTKYVITMNTHGSIYFTSKSEEKSDTKRAYSQRIGLGYGSHRKEGKYNKGYRFNEMETRIKQSSSSFTLTLQAKMANGVVVTSILQGSKSKVILKTQSEVPEDCSFHMGFSVPKAPEDLKSKGVLVKLSDKKEKFTHRCNVPYETKHYKVPCRQVLVQKRNPLSLIFDAGKAEGSFKVVQHSHNAGGVLNNNFSIYYSSKNKNWVASKNTFIFSF